VRFRLFLSTIRHEFGGAAESMLDEAEYLADCPTRTAWSSFPADFSRSPPKGNPLSALIASAFDGYFGTGVARHSLAV
jgi:oxygen-independent coproporphyrinogen-3 oxidase